MRHERLLEAYALRARELSDEVARLGKFRRIKAEFLEVAAEVKRRRALCNAAADEFEQYLEEQ